MRDLQVDTTTWISCLTSGFSFPCDQRSSPKNNVMFSYFCSTQQPTNSSWNLIVYSFFTLILDSCIEWHGVKTGVPFRSVCMLKELSWSGAFLCPFWVCSPVHQNTALCDACAISADVAALLDTVLCREFNFNLHPTLGEYLVLVLL